ncbi:MAG: hypothetical protein IPQ12_12790 [Polaromonas sp.]|nr:hypothetical protein [Polaromonas sp.]
MGAKDALHGLPDKPPKSKSLRRNFVGLLPSCSNDADQDWFTILAVSSRDDVYALLQERII